MAESIYTRVFFIHVKGATLFSVDDFEMLAEFGIPVNQEFDQRFLEIGEKIELDNKEYTIKSIFVVIHNETHQPHNYGISVSRVGEMLPVNFELKVYVDDK